MAISIFDPLKEAEMIAFTETIDLTRGFMGEQLFPRVKTTNLEVEFERMTSQAKIPVMALVHGFDTEANIGERETYEKVKFEKFYVKEKISQSETLRQLRKQNVSDQSTILKYIYDDLARESEKVLTRFEVMCMELISTGKISVNENNLDIEVDFGVPDGNRFAFDWTDPTRNVLLDIQKMKNAAKALGRTVNTVLTTASVYEFLRSNVHIQRAIYGSTGNGMFISDDQLNGLLRAKFGVSVIFNDEVYSYYDGTVTNENGVVRKNRVVKRFIPEGTFVMFAAGADGSAGACLFGDTPLMDLENTYSNGFLNYRQDFEGTSDMKTLWSVVGGLAVPIIPDPDGVVIGTIDIQSELGDLTVTSVAGLNQGDTIISVEGDTGGILKYKTGASITETTFGQKIIGGYTTLEGSGPWTLSGLTAGNQIYVVECSELNEAKNAGQATITVQG